MTRSARIAAADAAGPFPPEVDAWVAHPAAAIPLLASIAARQPGARRTPVIVLGQPTVPLSVHVAIVEGEPHGGSPIQRALQLGANLLFVPNALHGAATQGAAAWYHGWKPRDLDRWAGALLAGRTAGSEVRVDRDGAFRVSGRSRRDVLAATLVSSTGDGPRSPEVQVRLGSVFVQAGRNAEVSVWGVIGGVGKGGTRHRVSFDRLVEEVVVDHAPPDVGDFDDLAEPTMSVHPPDSGEKRSVPLSDLVDCATMRHGEVTMVAIWARDPGQWSWLEDWATEARVARLTGSSRVTRTCLPNLSAARFTVKGATASDPCEALLATPVVVDVSLLR